MDEKIKYLQLWHKAVKNAAEALKSGNMKEADKFHNQMEDAYKKYAEAARNSDEILNSKFAALNMAYESVLPYLLSKNKKVVNEGISLMKNDKNLIAQYNFHNAMKNYNCDGNAIDYVNEAWDMTRENIDRSTVDESNRKFAKFLAKNGIKPIQIDEERYRYNHACDYLMSNQRKLGNLAETTNAVKTIGEYIEKHKKPNRNNNAVNEAINLINSKLKILSENERELVNTIIDSKKNVDETKKKSLFNRIKNECLKKIDKVISESDAKDKERLLSIRETIMMKEFSNESVVADVAKLLEIGSVLSDDDCVKSI